MNNSNVSCSVEEGGGTDPLEKLLPALLQIFLTMGLGWFAGAMKIFGPKEARGLGIFVGKFSLPALIFISLCTLNLGEIKWSFLLGVFLSKIIIFSFVFLLDYFLNKNTSRAALFAIFSTTTNDFGMGLPILNSLFDEDPIGLKGLLFLVAPISLLILNPIGFTLMELGKNRNDKNEGKITFLLAIVKGLLTNPIVAMTILGVLGNLAMGSQPPFFLQVFSKKLGAAFTALAPFSLGLSAAGKVNDIKADVIKPIAALVILKTIVAPLLFYIIIGNIITLMDGFNPCITPILSNFALLLGSFPTALGVASYSLELTDLISPAIILATFVSVPLIYMVANILTTLSESLEALARADHSWIDCIITIVSCIIILYFFISKKRILHSPHLQTSVIILLTLISSSTCLLHTYIHVSILPALHLTALHASRLITIGLAVKLLTIARSSSTLSNRIVNIFLIISPLASFFTFLLLLCDYNKSYYAFGLYQDYFSLAFNIVSLIPTSACLFLLCRSEHAPLPGIQMFRHSLLLLALSTAMFSSIVVSLGRLTYNGDENEYPGSFKAILCLDKTMSAGQGMLFLYIFGLDTIGQKIAQLQEILTGLFIWAKNENLHSITSNFIMVAANNETEDKEEKTKGDGKDNELTVDKKDEVLELGVDMMTKERKKSVPGRSV